MQKQILVAEDNKEIAKVLRLYLTGAGYNAIIVNNGLEALEEIENTSFDLAIVDIMMPKMDGFQLIKEIRKTLEIPVLILSAKNEEYDKICGLNIGADDYITKPFKPLELMARVNASLRRWGKMNVDESNLNKLEVGELSLDINMIMLKKNDKEIPLTATEFKILRVLMNHPNQIFSKKQLCENIHGDYFHTDENVIMVHVSHIRDKIGENANGNSYIKTIRGLGYKIENK